MSYKADLQVAYRPTDLDEIVGQRRVVASLRKADKDQSMPHAILFHGPSGVGKTTLARIVAGMFDSEVSEYNGADYTGIDAWRDVLATLTFRPMGARVRVIIVDECHRLSPQAWDSLLKAIEEPPEFVYWILCTTELRKVRPTIQTRCVRYGLTLVNPDDLGELFVSVNDHEGLGLKDGWEFVEAAEGSPRQLLTCMASGIAERATDGEGDLIDIMRPLAQGRLSWKAATKVLSLLDKPNPESLRRTMCAYFTAVALKSSAKNAASAIAVLDAFSRPYEHTQNLAPFLVSLAEVLLNND